MNMLFQAKQWVTICASNCVETRDIDWVPSEDQWEEYELMVECMARAECDGRGDGDGGWAVWVCAGGAGAMNPPAPGKTPTRSSGYHQKALAEIRNSLLPFANIGNSEPPGSSAASTVSSGVSSGFSSSSGNGLDKDLNVLPQSLNQLITLGYDEVCNMFNEIYQG